MSIERERGYKKLYKGEGVQPKKKRYHIQIFLAYGNRASQFPFAKLLHGIAGSQKYLPL